MENGVFKRKVGGISELDTWGIKKRGKLKTKPKFSFPWENPRASEDYKELAEELVRRKQRLQYRDC